MICSAPSGIRETVPPWEQRPLYDSCCFKMATTQKRMWQSLSVRGTILWWRFLDLALYLVAISFRLSSRVLTKLVLTVSADFLMFLSGVESSGWPIPPFYWCHYFYHVLLIFFFWRCYLFFVHLFPNGFFLSFSCWFTGIPWIFWLSIACHFLYHSFLPLCLLLFWSSNKIDVGLPGSCLLSFISHFPLYLLLVYFKIIPGLHISIH